MKTLVDHPGLLGYHREFIRRHSHRATSLHLRLVFLLISIANLLAPSLLAWSSLVPGRLEPWQQNLMTFVVGSLVAFKAFLPVAGGISLSATVVMLTMWSDRGGPPETVDQKRKFQEFLFRDIASHGRWSPWRYYFWNAVDAAFVLALALAGWYVSAVAVLVARPVAIGIFRLEREAVAEFVKSLTADQVAYLDRPAVVREVRPASSALGA